MHLPPERVRARLFEAVAQSSAPRPGAWRRRLRLAGLSAAAWLSVAVVISGIRRDWSELPWLSLAVTLATLLVVASLAWVAGLARGKAMVGGATEALVGALGALLLVLHALVIVIAPGGPSTASFPGLAATITHALRCLLLTIVVALPLIPLSLIPLRGLILARPGLAGACLGLGAATWAHVVVCLHCPIGGPGHALIGHLLPCVPLMLAGAWITRAADGHWTRGGAKPALRLHRP